MSIFQNSVVIKYLNLQDKSKINEKWEVLKKHFLNSTIQENIRNSNEEQYQGEFLIDLFVNVLGYTKNPQPNFNLTTELKNEKDSKKADGAIIINEKVVAVIELKGTNTNDLQKIETQAFGYKNNQKDCIYVITSNFEKIRFYIDNAIDCLEFNLFNLNEKEFELLYLCLAYENILKGIPKKIKEESLSQEETITKKLYMDYSVFKRELYQNLTKLNPEYPALELFKKSQKLIDRFLFLFFAEDRQLLPPNSVRLILQQWNQLKELDEYVPLYERFKKYFGYLNTGFKGKQFDVFAYNGGLFKPDEILDNILIDDNILYNHTLKLSEYDFVSEIDVNILGHIFENSLNELDEIKAQLNGEQIDKSKTKRKKDGVFYTPKYITKYIVDNTLGKICSEKKNELQIIDEEYFIDKKRQQKTKQALIDKLNSYRSWLLQITIIDPACGSGAFLNEALNFLINEHKYIDQLETNILGGGLVFQNVENSILENNLFGVDLNEESVEIAKLSLWLRTAKPNRKLSDLSLNIKCGNSLIDDPLIAGDKAFNWQKEFPKVFENGGFDVVIGNPPYVQVKDDYYKNYFTQKCFDLYALFFEKGINLNKANGYFGFITPSLFIKGMRYDLLRKYILDNVQIVEIIEMGDDVFSNVQMPTAISIFIKKKMKNQKNVFSLENDSVISKMKNNSLTISEITKIMRGLEIGKDKVTSLIDSIQFLTGEDIYRYGIHKYSYISNEIYDSYKKDNYYFTEERIIIRETGNKITSIFINDNKTQQNRSLYAIKIIDKNLFKYQYILAVLNSKLIQYYYQKKFVAATDIFPKIRIGQVKEIPIKNIVAVAQQPFVEKADIMLALNKELQEVKQKFIKSIQRKFEIESLPNKLQDWYLLSYKEFIKELEKKKIKLSLSQEAEWEDYFIQESKIANEIKLQIEKTDKEIDLMVYKLYDLTDDEIEIIEKS